MVEKAVNLPSVAVNTLQQQHCKHCVLSGVWAKFNQARDPLQVGTLLQGRQDSGRPRFSEEACLLGLRHTSAAPASQPGCHNPSRCQELQTRGLRAGGWGWGMCKAFPVLLWPGMGTMQNPLSSWGTCLFISP